MQFLNLQVSLVCLLVFFQMHTCNIHTYTKLVTVLQSFPAVKTQLLSSHLVCIQ